MWEKTISYLVDTFAWLAKWACVFLVLLTVQQVIARYMFSSSSIALQELEWHLFSLVFLLAAAYTLKENAHVRVDVFYANQSKRNKARIDLFGYFFLFLPMVLLTIYYGWDFSVLAYKYTSPLPSDYYSAKWFSESSVGYRIFAVIETFLRAYIIRGESSADPGGLEARWLTKGMIPLGFLLLLLEGIKQIIRSIQTVRGR